MASGSRGPEPVSNHETPQATTVWPQLWKAGKVLSFVLQDLITHNYRMPQGDPFTLGGPDWQQVKVDPSRSLHPVKTWSLMPLEILPNFMQIGEGKTRIWCPSCQSQLFQLNWSRVKGRGSVYYIGLGSSLSRRYVLILSHYCKLILLH